MRVVWLAPIALVAACGGPTDTGAYCTIDADCSGGDVCARTHECLAPDQVHSVKIEWTIAGQPASATSCSGIAELEVGYQVGGDPTTEVLFSPVACAEGAFPNDKWPTRFDTAIVIALSQTASTEGRTSIPPDPMADVTIDVARP